MIGRMQYPWAAINTLPRQKMDFEKHFLEILLVRFDPIFTQECSHMSILHIVTLVQVMSRCQTGDKL